MFGYIKPLTAELKVKEYELYRAVYCGLCASLGKRVSFFAKFTLSYDFVFLALVRMAAAGETGRVERRRCLAHPTKKRAVITGSNQLDLCAEISALLTLGKLRDDATDEKGLKRLSAKLLLPIARRMSKRAERSAERSGSFSTPTGCPCNECSTEHSGNNQTHTGGCQCNECPTEQSGNNPPNTGGCQCNERSSEQNSNAPSNGVFQRRECSSEKNGGNPRICSADGACGEAGTSFMKLGETIRGELEALALIEKENILSPDAAAEPFGRLMAAVCSYGFAENSFEWRLTREIGLHIGRFIYLVDAVDDLADDVKNRSYNPFADGDAPVDELKKHEKMIRTALTMELSGVSKAAELFDADASQMAIIRNIIYLGLPKVIDGLFSEKSPEKHRNASRTVCGGDAGNV